MTNPDQRRDDAEVRMNAARARLQARRDARKQSAAALIQETIRQEHENEPFLAGLARLYGLGRRELLVATMGLPAALTVFSKVVDDLKLPTMMMRAAAAWRDVTRALWGDLAPLLQMLGVRMEADAYDLGTLCVLAILPSLAAFALGRRESYVTLLRRAAVYPVRVGVWSWLLLPVMLIAPTAIFIGGVTPFAMFAGILAFVGLAPLVILPAMLVIHFWRRDRPADYGDFPNTWFWVLFVASICGMALVLSIPPSDALSATSGDHMSINRSALAPWATLVFIASNVLHWRVWPLILINFAVLIVLHTLNIWLTVFAAYFSNVLTRVGA
jgi:hypothetical protein